jgi:hypothetical protein
MMNSEFIISSAIGKDKQGKLVPIIRMQLGEWSTILETDEAIDLAGNIFHGAIRASIDVKIVGVMLARGASRDECQKFLDALRDADDD